MIQAAAAIERKVQVAAFKSERSLYVIIKNPTVLQFQVLNEQSEKRLALRFCGFARHRGNICRSIFFHADVHMRFAKNELRERHFAPPERIEVQSSADF